MWPGKETLTLMENSFAGLFLGVSAKTQFVLNAKTQFVQNAKTQFENAKTQFEN